MQSPGTLYVVATPIGNMGDITYRAVEVLKNVAIIYAEDTRVFNKLKERYSIPTKSSAYNAHATKNVQDKIVRQLIDGNHIALVSDAGTPGISDPGALLVSYIRTNYPEIPIVPVPGPSAVIAAVSVSGILGNSFTFAGFIPHKKGRETFLNKAVFLDTPTVFYESTHRIETLLQWFIKNAPQTKILIAREITKMFETITITTADEHLNAMQLNPKEKKGEFTIIIFPK